MTQPKFAENWTLLLRILKVTASNLVKP